jgi:lipoprotein-anchoring transpeptidase ErfK/SrfK
MNNLKLNKVAMIVGIAIVFATQAWSQSAPTANAQIPAANQQAPAPTPVPRLILISLEDRKLALVEDGQVKKVYNVAVGKPSTPSPIGTFTIARRVANPTYHHAGKTVLPGPGNPVGTRWMGLSEPGYGIHGTNEPKSIGKAASHGCIRMAKADLEEFYTLVAEGDTVELVGQRNDETARIFSDQPNLAAQPAATAVAAAEPAPAAAPAKPGAQSAASAEKTTLESVAVAAFTALR